MSGGEVIGFPCPPVDPANAPVRVDGEPVTVCVDPIHVYPVVPGRCQCREHWWDGATNAITDLSSFRPTEGTNE